jgi:SAM-dependent methyltransferase
MMKNNGSKFLLGLGFALRGIVLLKIFVPMQSLCSGYTDSFIFMSVPKTHHFLLRWPLSALMAWTVTWALFLFVLAPRLPLLLAVTLATAAGVLCSVMAGTFWRRLAIAAGFPLSLLLSGSIALPAWAWLLPLLLILLIYPMNAWRDAPLFPTPALALRALEQHVPLAPNALILDAGCGLGHGLHALRLAYPAAQLVGIEWSWPLRLLTAVRCPWATIRQGDIWKANWHSYDMVYLFQRPESMPRAVAKARTELKPGAWLVSLEFKAEELQAQARVQTVEGKPVWLYQAPFLFAEEQSKTTQKSHSTQQKKK